MRPARLLQAGGWAGLVFLVLNAVGQVSAFGADAKVNDPIPSIVDYYAANGRQMIRAVIILSVGVFFFIWFLGALHRRLSSDLDPGNPFPAVVLISGSLACGMLLLERIPQVILAIMADQPGGLSPDLAIRALADMQGVLTSAFVVTLGVLTPAVAAGLVRQRLAGPWLAWLGGISSALFVVSGFGSYATIDNDTLDTLLHGADLGAYIVVVIAAIALIRQPASVTARARTSLAPAADGSK